LLLTIELLSEININGIIGLGSFAIGFAYAISPFVGSFAVGSIVLATVGEFVLSILPPTNRSLVSVMEKLPSDFKIITGMQECGKYNLRSHLGQEIKGHHHGVTDRLKLILLKKDINQILCFSKSLWIVERVSEIEEEFEKDFSKNVKVIKLPDEIAIRKLAKQAYEGYPSLDSLLGKRAVEFDESWEDYIERLYILDRYLCEDFDIGDLRFILTEYNDGSMCIMFLTRDLGPIGNIVGMYSEEPYIIENYYNLFENIWRLKRREALNRCIQS